MKARAEGKGYTNYATELIWDEIDPRDDKDVAEALLKFAQAMALAGESSLISEEAAVKFLAQYVDTMSDYISDDERSRRAGENYTGPDPPGAIGGCGSGREGKGPNRQDAGGAGETKREKAR